VANDQGSNPNVEDLKGKAKEAVGGATGDESLERQGRTDQAKADVKKAAEDVKSGAHEVGEKAKQTVKDATDKIKDATGR
jgi:uncharacterized protein YjbJ (UPF0337 family)